MDNPAPKDSLLNLSGKVAIVTGGALGIGFGIAYRLAEAGAKVMIADFKEQEAAAAVQKLMEKGWVAKAVKVDISNEADVSKMVTETVAAFGGVDILVNNAGIYPSIPVLQMSVGDFDRGY